MRSMIFLIAPAALALAQVFSPAANAQPAAPNSPQAKVEQRIRDMYATLHISKAQNVEWNAFAQVMLDNAQAMEKTLEQNGGDRDKLNAEQILDNYAAISAQHAQNVERLEAAFDMLYPSLSPEQKRAADEMFRNVGPKKAGMHK